MSVDTWLAFVAVSAALLLSPGPVAALAISYATRLGRARAMAFVPGAVLGDFAAMSISLLGVGAILAELPYLFVALKLLGAFVLIFLGARMTSAATSQGDEPLDNRDVSLRLVFWSGFVVTALHPSGFVFFVSFAPQFLDASRPATEQIAILISTFLAIAALTTSLWVLIADAALGMIGASRVKKFSNITCGALLIALGVFSIGVEIFG